MTSYLKHFSNVSPSSKEETQQNDGHKFELWPEH